MRTLPGIAKPGTTSAQRYCGSASGRADSSCDSMTAIAAVAITLGDLELDCAFEFMSQTALDPPRAEPCARRGCDGRTILLLPMQE